MPKLESEVFDIILQDIRQKGFSSCPESVEECKDILRKKADGTMKVYRQRAEAFLRLVADDIVKDKDTENANFNLLVSRVINSKELKDVLFDYLKYGTTAIYDDYDSTFKEAFAGGLGKGKQLDVDEIKDSISNIKVILEEEKKNIGDIKLREGIAADNKQVAAFILTGIRSLDRITPVVDEIGACMARKMDMSIDFVGYQDRVNIILSFIGAELDDDQYKNMLSEIRHNTRMQTIIVAAARYMDMKILNDRLKDFKYAFFGESTDINFNEQEQDFAFARIESDLIARKAKLEKKSIETSTKELEILANTLKIGTTEADPMIDRVVNNIQKLERMSIESDKLDYLRHNFNREPAANETIEDAYTNRLQIFLSIVGAQLSAEEYEMFVLSLKTNEEAKSFVDSCIKYCDFDGLYSRRFMMQGYLIADYKTVVKGVSPLDAYRMAKKYVDKMQEEYEEKQNAVVEGKTGVNPADEEAINIAVNEEDEIDYNSDEYYNDDDDEGDDANEIEEANVQRNVQSKKEQEKNLGDQILSQAIIINNQKSAEQIEEGVDIGAAFIIGGVFFAGIALLNSHMNVVKAGLIETQSNKAANFGNDLMYDMPVSGSTTYRNMTAALNKVIRGTELFKYDDKDVNLTLKELYKSLNDLKAAATEYYKSHTGLRGLFKGYSDDGKKRIALAKDIMEGTDKEINRIKDYAKASGISLGNEPDAMSIRGQWINFKNNHEGVTDEHIKPDSTLDDDVRAEINDWNKNIEIKEQAREKVKGISSISMLEERMDMLGLGVLQVSPVTMAKRYVTNEYLDMIRMAGTAGSALTVEDIQSDILSSDFADVFYNKVLDLSNNKEFSDLVSKDPNSALKKWKAKNKSTLDTEFEGRVQGNEEYQELAAKEPNEAKNKWTIAEHRIEVCKREWSKENAKIDEIRAKVADPKSPFKLQFGEDANVNKKIKIDRKAYSTEVANTLGRVLTMSYLKDTYEANPNNAMKLVLDPKQLKKIQTFFTEGIKRDFLNGHVNIDKLNDKLDNFEAFKKQSLKYIQEGMEREARAKAPKPPKKVEKKDPLKPENVMVLKPNSDFPN